MRAREERPKSRFDALIGTLDLVMTTDEFIMMLRGDPTMIFVDMNTLIDRGPNNPTWATWSRDEWKAAGDK